MPLLLRSKASEPLSWGCSVSVSNPADGGFKAFLGAAHPSPPWPTPLAPALGDSQPVPSLVHATAQSSQAGSVRLFQAQGQLLCFNSPRALYFPLILQAQVLQALCDPCLLTLPPALAPYLHPSTLRPWLWLFFVGTSPPPEDWLPELSSRSGLQCLLVHVQPSAHPLGMITSHSRHAAGATLQASLPSPPAALLGIFSSLLGN